MRRMEEFQAELQTNVTPTTTSSLASDFASFKNFVIASLHALQNQLHVIVRNQDSMEMQNRRKILLLHGLPETNTENAAAEVVKVIVSKLKVADFSASDIGRCHRMGHASALNKPRPVLVKIRDFSLRNKIWSAKANLKGSGITISEFLTKLRHDVFMAARQRYGVTRCWTREGTVFVLGPDGTRHRVTCLTELEKICAVVSSKNLEQSSTVPKEIITTTRTRRGAAAGTSKQ